MRRKTGDPTKTEEGMFAAYERAYKQAHGCTVRRTHFDSESRAATFDGPAFTIVATARRCKEMTKQLKFRKA